MLCCTNSRPIAAGAFLVVVCLGLPVRSNAMLGCVNSKTGATRTLLHGGSCLKTETPLPLPYQLVDATGKFVGSPNLFADYGSQTEVNVSIKGNVYELLVDAAVGFDYSDSDVGINIEMLYTTPDCSGTPYLAPVLPVGDGSPVANPLIRSTFGSFGPFVFNGVLYYPTSLSPLLIQSVGYFTDPTQLPEQCLQDVLNVGPATISVGQISTFDLLTLGFHPPFHIQ